MKRIAIFPHGKAVIDSDARVHIRINGEEPTSYVEHNERNMEKHFPQPDEAKPDAFKREQNKRGVV